MADVLFISESNLKENTSVSNNVSPKLLLPYVSLAQELYILPVLGEDLYEQIIDQISGGTISSTNQTLIDKSVKTVVFYSLYESLPFIRNRIDQTGVVFNVDDRYEAVDITSFNALRQSIKNNAESFMDQFKDWLCENKSDYPLLSGNISGNTYDLGGFVF